MKKEKKILRVTYKPHRFALNTDFEVYEDDVPRLIRLLINFVMEKQTKIKVVKKGRAGQ